MNVERRLFIGGLGQNITEDDIKRCFQRFGDIGNIEVKAKTNASDGRQNFFAYLNINITDENLKRCTSTYNNAKWKGSRMRVQLAKNNFLLRLRNERECSQKTSYKPILARSQRSLADKEVNQINAYEQIRKSNSIIFDEMNYENSSYEYNVPVVELTWNMSNASEAGKSFNLRDCRVSDNNCDLTPFKSSWSIDKVQESSVKVSGTRITSQSNQSSLSSKSKINRRSQNNNEENEQNMEKKMSLFDHSSDEEPIDCNEFEIRPHLEGTRGQELLNLQRTYHGDTRFKLDERFLEDRGSDSNKSLEETLTVCKVNHKDDDSVTPVHFENDRQNMFKVLQGMIGNLSFTDATSRPSSGKKMRRYDPSDKNHSDYERLSKETTEKDVNHDHNSRVNLDDSIVKENESHCNHSTVISSLGEYFSGGSKAATTPFRFTLQTKERPFGDIVHETDVNSDKKNIKPSIGYKQSIFSNCSSTSDENEDFENKPATSPVNEIDPIAGQKLFFCTCENWTECSWLCAGVTKFGRTDSFDKVKENWLHRRSDLLKDFKKKHKEAVKRHRKRLFTRDLAHRY